jgi:hypothetical protein
MTYIQIAGTIALWACWALVVAATAVVCFVAVSEDHR